MERTCAILIRTNLTVWSGQPYRYRGLAVPFKRNMQFNMSDKDIVINDIDAGNTTCQVCLPRLVCQKETGKFNLIDQSGSCKVNIIE